MSSTKGYNCFEQFWHDLTKTFTKAVRLVILVPPAAPTTSLTPASSVNTDGDIEDSGLLPGLMKLFGEGGTPKWLVMLGAEKSSISSLSMIRVRGDISREPKLEQG